MYSALEALGIQEINNSSCISGHWFGDESVNVIESINPADLNSLAKIRPGTAAEYQRMIGEAEKVFAVWRNIPAPKRGEAVRRIAAALRDKKHLLGNLVALETGKIKAEADGEVQEMIDIADFAVGQSRMLYGKTMPSERPQHRLYEQWLPLGVVGVITAFNFPVAVWAWNAFIAAVAGNTVIWKPSPKTPLCAIAVQHICNQILSDMGYPGIFSLFIPDDNKLLNPFVEDQHIPLISFTGSSAVGRMINRKVATRLGKCLLELSGNNAVIIDKYANLELAIPAIVFGAVGTAGQRCTTTRRLFVHELLYKSVIKQLLYAYQHIVIGNPLAPEVLVGPLIDAAAVERFKQAIVEIKQQGGDIIYGGKIVDGKGYFVEPTLVGAENHWAIVQQETFAPILYLMTFKTIEQAIALQNDVPQGLSSALFTDNLHHAELYLSAVGSDCGIANINIGTSGAEIGGAFGGEKDTGGGREAGSDAWKNYMRRQTNTINWGTHLPLAQGIQFSIDSSNRTADI